MSQSRSLILISGLSAFVAIGGLTGCAMWEGKKARETGRTVDQYVSDKRVTDRVEDALKATPVYKFPDVHVDTFLSTVQLSGFVHTDEQKRQAEQIARNVPGVNRVIDDLTLVPENPAPTGRSQGYQNEDRSYTNGVRSANPAYQGNIPPQNNPGGPR
jgi:hyperosmotically inducible periplasmic protein